MRGQGIGGVAIRSPTGINSKGAGCMYLVLSSLIPPYPPRTFSLSVTVQLWNRVLARFFF